jgi:ech hydrogenase subunit D
MSEPQEIVVIGKNELMGRVAQLFAEGYRLVQIGCSTLPDGYELNYSFDEGYRFKNLRILAAPGEEVPSISAIYANSFLYENEIHDLFGVAVKNIAIDYHGTLYRTTVKVPFSVENVKFSEPPKPKAAAPPQKPGTAAQKPEAPAQKADAPAQGLPQQKELFKEQPQNPEGQKE